MILLLLLAAGVVSWDEFVDSVLDSGIFDEELAKTDGLGNVVIAFAAMGAEAGVEAGAAGSNGPADRMLGKVMVRQLQVVASQN